MTKFPKQFVDVLTKDARSVLNWKQPAEAFNMDNGLTPYWGIRKAVQPKWCEFILNLMETRIHHLIKYREIGGIPDWAMECKFEDNVPQHQRMRLSWPKIKKDPCHDICESIGLIEMMTSDSVVEWTHKLTGYETYNTKKQVVQINGYSHGDYIFTHADNHVDSEGNDFSFVDIHMGFVNQFVESQYLIYQRGRYLNKMRFVANTGGISVYRLPFWHYTTPLQGKKGHEKDARRWLILTDVQVKNKRMKPFFKKHQHRPKFEL